MDCKYMYAVKGDISLKFDEKMKENVRKSDFVCV